MWNDLVNLFDTITIAAVVLLVILSVVVATLCLMALTLVRTSKCKQNCGPGCNRCGSGCNSGCNQCCRRCCCQCCKCCDKCDLSKWGVEDKKDPCGPCPIPGIPPKAEYDRLLRETMKTPPRAVGDLPPEVIAPSIMNPPRPEGGFGSKTDAK